MTFTSVSSFLTIDLIIFKKDRKESTPTRSAKTGETDSATMKMAFQQNPWNTLVPVKEVEDKLFLAEKNL